MYIKLRTTRPFSLVDATGSFRFKHPYACTDESEDFPSAAVELSFFAILLAVGPGLCVLGCEVLLERAFCISGCYVHVSAAVEHASCHTY